MRSFISIKDMSKNDIQEVLKLAQEFELNKHPKLLKDKIVACAFFENSTRTRLSFETAINQMEGKVIGFANTEGTSVKKGETLADTIKMLDRYADLIVMRHYHDGSSRWASMNATVPVINGGDGANQHPSQTLLDLYTIEKQFKSLNNLKVILVGDLKYGRTAHSLVMGLRHFNVELIFVSPKFLSMPSHIKDYLTKTNTKWSETSDLSSVINSADVLYMTRLQKERFSSIDEYEKVKDYYILTKKDIANVKDSFIILHPLPRVDEIATDIDNTKHALYFDQALNGVHVRKAMITIALDLLKRGE